MGASNSNNLNIVIIASVIQATAVDLENLILYFENRPLILQGLDLIYEEHKLNKALEAAEDESSVISTENSSIVGGLALASDEFAIAPRNPPPVMKFDNKQKEQLESMNYNVTPEKLHQLLEERNFDPSDISVMDNLYLLQDKRGFRQVDVRNIAIAISVLLAKTPRDCLEFALRQYDRNNSDLIEKSELHTLFVIMNDTLLYFGDKHLAEEQIRDLVDSIFTTAGKIDGLIYYPNFYDLIVSHPIVEMLLSPQFQGLTRDKIFDEDTLALMDLRVR